MHKAYKKNKVGRDFVVGDVHGNFSLLFETMKQNSFDTSKDRLFSVGDIIDRGKQSLKCLSLLHEPWFFMVRGNHEQMMMDAIMNGGGYNWAIEYGKWSRNLSSDELREWAALLKSLPISITLDCDGFSAGICHAETYGFDWLKMRDDHESEAVMVWGRRVLRNRPKENVKGVDITVHGHTPLELPTWVGNRYFLDTGAWYSDVLTFRTVKSIYDEYKASDRLFAK